MGLIDPREVERPTMAEVLEKHQHDTEKKTLHRHCTCGWTTDVFGGPKQYTAHQQEMLVESGYGYVGDIRLMIENKRNMSRFNHATADDCEANGDPVGRKWWRTKAIEEWQSASELARWIGEDKK